MRDQTNSARMLLYNATHTFVLMPMMSSVPYELWLGVRTRLQHTQGAHHTVLVLALALAQAHSIATYTTHIITTWFPYDLPYAHPCSTSAVSTSTSTSTYS